MKQAPDRKKLRREYLRKKWKAQVKVILGAAFGTVMGFSALILICFLCLVLAFSPYWDEDGVETPATHCLRVALVFLIGSALIVASTWLAWYGGKTSKKGIAEAKNLPFVSPVIPDTLPADEILVRGSEEPLVEQSEVLLRAAKGVETPQEELLRITTE
jgi:hypothetical protein